MFIQISLYEATPEQLQPFFVDDNVEMMQSSVSTTTDGHITSVVEDPSYVYNGICQSTKQVLQWIIVGQGFFKVCFLFGHSTLSNNNYTLQVLR